MKGREVLYPWRVALFAIACGGWLSAVASIPLIAIFVIAAGDARTLFLILSIMFGAPALAGAVSGLIVFADWALETHFLSKEHRDYVEALRWADHEWPGSSCDGWEALRGQ